MCSINDQDIEILNELSLEKEQKPSSKTCQKCKEFETEYVIRKKDSYCEKCFVFMVRHKFRTPLGKSRLLSTIAGRVLIHFDVEQFASFSLVHLIRTAYNDKKRLKCSLEPVLLILTDKKLDDAVEREIRRLELETRYVSLHSFLENGSLEIVENVDDSSNNTANSTTFNEQIIEIKKREILVAAAKQLECRSVFVPTTANQLSVDVLYNIVIGRGSQLPQNTGFCDDRYDTDIFKPMKLLTVEELDIYNTIFDLPNQCFYRRNVASNSIKIGHRNSEKLALKVLDNFVVDLSDNYPSTVFTISGFVDKLVKTSDGIKCDNCQAIISVSNHEFNTESVIKMDADLTTNICYACLQIKNTK